MATPIYEVYLFESQVHTTPFILDEGRYNLSTLGEGSANADPIALFTGWNYLEFHQRVNQPWNHMIRFDLSKDDTRVALLRSTLDIDMIINVYRTDPYTGIKDRVYEGFNRTVVDQITSTGTVIFNLYGVGFTELLKRRIVVPATGEDNVSKSGVAETVMKEFVDEQAVNPTDSDRTIAGLTIEADAGAGGSGEYSARYTMLNTVIENLGEQGRMDFGIVQIDNIVGNFRFEVRRPWGTDKRIGNLDSNPPLVFDVGYGNMLIPILSKNASEEVTAVYVGGQGEGVDRTVVELENTARIAASPWNRRERFVDARRQSTETSLATTGNAKLQEEGYAPQLTFGVKQGLGSWWPTDWELGDYITARYYGLSFDKQITEVSVVVTASAEGSDSMTEVIDVELTDVVLFWTLGITGYSELEETTVFG